MKPFASFAALAVFVCVSSAEDVNKVAASTYAAVDRAFVKRDLKAVKAAMGPRVTSDFKAIVAGRGVSYENLLKNFEGMFADLPRISDYKTTIQGSKSTANAASFRIFSTLTAFSTGRDHKTHRYDFTNTSTDVWKKVGGKWKMFTTTTLAESRRMDGKLL